MPQSIPLGVHYASRIRATGVFLLWASGAATLAKIGIALGVSRERAAQIKNKGRAVAFAQRFVSDDTI